MIKIENVEVTGWEAAIRGMRNPMNSWEKSDSGYCLDTLACHDCKWNRLTEVKCKTNIDNHIFVVGKDDLTLMKKLMASGTDHRKFMRMITVYLDITAPLYWWKEMDTYQVGVTKNSCSTMHKIADKEFTLEDFSCEKLINSMCMEIQEMLKVRISPMQSMLTIVECLNSYRDLYLKTKDKKYWWQLIQLLPSSYNQRRTVMLNYEVLANMYKSRCNHKLDEWRELCTWIESLPYSELITGVLDGTDNN